MKKLQKIMKKLQKNYEKITKKLQKNYKKRKVIIESDKCYEKGQKLLSITKGI